MSQTYKTDVLISQDIDTYLKEHKKKSLLRFITCGSVDDGKSSLIGRLLYDSKMIFEDHLRQLKIDSKKSGTRGTKIDFSLIVDGLSAEREQGITIDVAYRFFSTEKRKFIVADTPGHEQFTRNMVTGASTAELAVILVDARKGILTQTRRHSYLCSLLGVKHIVLAVNKMDLVEFNKDIFETIVENYRIFGKNIGINNFLAIPLSATEGDNILERSTNTPWYYGSTLMKHLESVELYHHSNNKNNFRMCVQWVNRPNSEFRGFSGRISEGVVKPGDEVCILPGRKTNYVDRIVTYDGDLESAEAGRSITLTLKNEVDCSRGQIIVGAKAPPQVADQFETKLIWMDEEPLVPGRSYFLKIGSQTISVTLSFPKYRININNMEHVASKTLNLNEIGVVNITTDRPIPYTPYNQNKTLGGFILLNKITNRTVGAGLINFALRRAENIHWQKTDINRDHHANLKNQRPMVLWMTGLSGSGKSSIANEVEKKLADMHLHTFLLDGDNIRHGLNKDLGFTDADRIENIRRIGEVSKLMTDAGLIVITAFISPFKSERNMVRQMMKPGEFIEIFVDTPLEVAEKRDVKGLYAKARSGELKNFTGIDSPYEAPKKPEIHINTIKCNIEEAAEMIVRRLFR